MCEMDGLSHVFASFVTWISLRTWSILSFSLFCKSSLSASSMVDPPCSLFGRKALTESCVQQRRRRPAVLAVTRTVSGTQAKRFRYGTPRTRPRREQRPPRSLARECLCWGGSGRLVCVTVGGCCVSSDLNVLFEL